MAEFILKYSKVMINSMILNNKIGAMKSSTQYYGKAVTLCNSDAELLNNETLQSHLNLVCGLLHFGNEKVA